MKLSPLVFSSHSYHSPSLFHALNSFLIWIWIPHRYSSFKFVVHSPHSMLRETSFPEFTQKNYGFIYRIQWIRTISFSVFDGGRIHQIPESIYMYWELPRAFKGILLKTKQYTVYVYNETSWPRKKKFFNMLFLDLKKLRRTSRRIKIYIW